jgi:Golgi SNAP receptor complex protein 2
VKTTTQAERLAREAAANIQQATDRGMREGSKQSAAARDKARHAAGRGKEKARGTFEALMENKSNPVVVVNALLIAGAGGWLGYGAYQRHLKGALSWDLVALWGGAVGAAGAVDYFVSK